MMGIGLVVEGSDLAVTTAAVERDGLGQGTVRYDSKHLHSIVPGVPLQGLEEPPSEPDSARLWRHPHPLQLGRSARMKLECPAADGSLTQASDEQGTGRRGQLV